MSLTVSVRVEYVNAKKFSFQQRHDRRELKKPPHYINPELSHLNECALDKGFSGKELLELNRAVRQKAVEEGRCPLKHPKKIKNDTIHGNRKAGKSTEHAGLGVSLNVGPS